MNMELINIVNVQSEKYGCGKLIIFHVDTCRLLYMASGLVCSAIIDLTSISYSVDSHFILINSLSLFLRYSKWRAAFCLQEEVAFRRLRASVAHRNLLSNASVDAVRIHRRALFGDERILLTFYDGFGEIFPSARMGAEDC